MAKNIVYMSMPIYLGLHNVMIALDPDSTIHGCFMAINIMDV